MYYGEYEVEFILRGDVEKETRTKAFETYEEAEDWYKTHREDDKSIYIPFRLSKTLKIDEIK